MDIEKLAQDIISKHLITKTVPVDPKEIATNLRLKVDSIAGQQNHISSQGGVISCVYTDEKQHRLNLAFAIGRLVLNGILDNFKYDNNEWKDSYDPKNQKAARFARALLIPSYTMKILIVDKGMTEIAKISNTFYVSEVLCQKRLQELGYIR